MTNRAFIPTVRRACRAQCTISSSAAKQQKETEKEKGPHHPPSHTQNAHPVADRVGTTNMRKGIH